MRTRDNEGKEESRQEGPKDQVKGNQEAMLRVTAPQVPNKT